MDGLKDLDKAIADFNESFRLVPQNPYALGNRGNARQYRLKDYKQAIVDYDEALRLNPNFSKLGDFAKAEALQSRAVELAVKMNVDEMKYRLALYKAKKPLRIPRPR